MSQLTWSSSAAQQQLNNEEKLNATFSRKYDKGTLVHITNEMFEWVLDLEQERVNQLSCDTLNAHQDDLIEHVISQVNGNETLIDK